MLRVTLHLQLSAKCQQSVHGGGGGVVLQEPMVVRMNEAMAAEVFIDLKVDCFFSQF